jgi:ABC-type hemin transport system ATPase subunit
VLNADVEDDRRDLAVCAAVAVEPGERAPLFGPSGAGQTTLPETLASPVQPKAGLVELAAVADAFGVGDFLAWTAARSPRGGCQPGRRVHGSSTP